MKLYLENYTIDIENYIKKKDFKTRR